MEIVVEIVIRGTQRRETHGDRLARRDRLLAVELETFKFDRLIAGVDDLDTQGLPCWNGQRLRAELMVLETDLRGIAGARERRRT